MGTDQAALAVSAVGAVAVLAHTVVGVRASRSDKESAQLHFGTASVALVISALVILHVVPPVVGYGMICLTLAVFQLLDLLQDEHARRRRVASLVPRPAAEVIPTVWVGLAVASVFMLAPYVMLGEQRAAALVVGICAVVMAGIAWRIASAPVQLHGENVPSERMHDRASRSRKAGVTAVVAIGSIFVFISFVNAGLPTVLPLQRLLLNVSWVTWMALGAWVFLYSYRLNRLSSSAS